MNIKSAPVKPRFDFSLLSQQTEQRPHQQYAQMTLTHLKNTNLYFVHYQDKKQGLSFKRFISKEEYEQRTADFEMAISNHRMEYYTRLV